MPWTGVYKVSLKVGLLWSILVTLPSLLHEQYNSGNLSVVKGLVLRFIALITCAALYSLKLQAVGLMGDNGLIPLTNTLHTIRRFIAMSNTNTYFNEESVLKGMIRLVLEKFQPAEGDTKQLMHILNFDLLISTIAILWPHPVMFMYMYLTYYGYKRVCGPFLNFQWDALLLETLLIAIPLSLANNPWLDHTCLWMMHMLLFRLMFGSGVVKAYGKDESWFQSYTAISFHFLTQPLPNYIGMFVHTALPKFAFRYMTWFLLVGEVCLPLLSLLAVWPLLDKLVAIGITLLMMSIATTGYYGFFNMLTSVLTISLLHDNDLWTPLSTFLSPKTMKTIKDFSYANSSRSSRIPAVSQVSVWKASMQMVSMFICTPFIAMIVIVTWVALVKVLHRTGWVNYASDNKKHKDDETSSPDPNSPSTSTLPIIERVFQRYLSPFHEFTMTTFYLGNHYGLFANMTKQRDEIAIEVKVAGKDEIRAEEGWQQIEFQYKPDDIFRPPKPIIPFFHLPRLDWMMWFLALKPSTQFYPKWFWNLMLSLAESNDDVLALLHDDGQRLLREKQLEVLQQPNRELYFRLILYRYDFHKQRPLIKVDSKTKRQYWTREKVKELLPPLTKDGLLNLFEQFDGREAEKERQKNEKPTVETAAEVIMRTLFRKKGQRRKQQHQQRAEQHSKEEEGHKTQTTKMSEGDRD